MYVVPDVLKQSLSAFLTPEHDLLLIIHLDVQGNISCSLLFMEI